MRLVIAVFIFYIALVLAAGFNRVVTSLTAIDQHLAEIATHARLDTLRKEGVK